MTEKAAKPSALGGLFSTAKSLFVEEVEVPDKASPKPLVTPGTIFSYGPVGQGGSGAAPHVDVTVAVAADPEAKRSLEARLQAAMPPAYKAFMEQHEALGGVVTDDAQRFQAALKTSHTTIDQLLQAIDSLTGILQAASQNFADDNKDRKTKATTEAQKNIDATDALIASSEAQLQVMQQTIATLREKRNAAAQDVQSDVAHLEEVRLGFAGAVAAITGQLDAQRRTIATMTRKS